MERVIGPDANILVDFMLDRLKHVLESLNIYPENMEKNIWLTGGLIFSQKVLLKLVDKGLTREEAYELVQKNAMRSWERKENFKQLLLNDQNMRNFMSPEEIEECFDLSNDLKSVDYIFDRVFSKSGNR